MKFILEDTQVILREVPDEISLSINISNCPHKCKGCHSPYLREDIGDELTIDAIDKLISKHEGISCVCFFGGDRSHDNLIPLFDYVKSKNLKVAWYSGDDSVDEHVVNKVDYIKIGRYDEELGPLDSKTTNQRLYKVITGDNNKYELIDITNKFWKEQ